MHVMLFISKGFFSRDLTIKQAVNGPLQEAIIFKNEPRVVAGFVVIINCLPLYLHKALEADDAPLVFRLCSFDLWCIKCSHEKEKKTREVYKLSV